jgi:5-methylthioadenosine/S-adenosylhomocysteine deaminase
MERIDTLVCARWIAPVEPDLLLSRHAVAIRGGRIVAVLPEAEARSRYEARETIDRPHHLLTPGLVNAHVPASRALLRGIGDGLARDAWDARLNALESTWGGPEYVRDGTTLAVAELLAAGVTCFGDSSGHPDVVAAAAIDAGIRIAVGVPIAEEASAWAADADEHFDKGLRVHDEYRDHPLVTATFTARSIAALRDGTLQRLKVLVDQLEAPFTVPVHESAAAVAACRRDHGATPIARLARLGLLNSSLAALHATHLGPEDVAWLGRARTRVVHSPTADLKLGGGIAPVVALLEAGCDVALGSGPAVATNDVDLGREARLALLLTAGTHGGPAALPAAAALRMATLAGATALGIDDRTGSLRAGKWADLACFDVAKLPAVAHEDPLTALVQSGGRDFVTDTWVAGRPACANGAPVRLDLADLASRAAGWRRRMLADGSPAARQ